MEKQTAAFKSKPLVTRAECAELLTDEGYPTTKGTLQKLASVGGGPEYQIFGYLSYTLTVRYFGLA